MKRRPISRRLASSRRAAMAWNARAQLSEPDQAWWASPAGPCRSIPRDSPEFAEIEARYCGRTA